MDVKIDQGGLTPEQVQDLRRSVLASQKRLGEGVRVPADFFGGPLDGVRIAVATCTASCQLMDWCIPTREGLILVHYVTDGVGRWRFIGVAMPANPRREGMAGPPAGRQA